MGEYHPLYGRRILHYLSPMRWRKRDYDFQRCSNFKAVLKTLHYLPMCHHYILFPKKNVSDILKFLRENKLDKNVSVIPFYYPASVLKNRTFFDNRLLEQTFKFDCLDIDFIFNHQPEVTFNIMNSILSKRYGTSVHIIQFFHWVDSPRSRPIDNFTPNFWRQLEGIYISDKTFIHCNLALEYLKTNFSSDIVFPFTDNFLENKISYYTAGFEKFTKKPKPFELPNKKILLFNHRWNHTTGIKKLISISKKLNPNKYIIWMTDEESKNPKAGQSVTELIDPKLLHIESLSVEQYQYLIKNSFAALCFVDKYATWNLSVQETIRVGTPTIVYHHPVMDYIIGKNYPLFFKQEKEFFSILDSIDKTEFKWDLPNHEKNFRDNLYKSMIDCIDNYNSKKRKDNETGRIWLYHIFNGNGYKKNILKNTHPNLWLSNNWEHLRRWCLMMGAKDDPTKKYTYMFIPEENREKINKMVRDIDEKIRIYDGSFVQLDVLNNFFED